jgi:hypothetical protein
LAVRVTFSGTSSEESKYKVRSQTGRSGIFAALSQRNCLEGNMAHQIKHPSRKGKSQSRTSRPQDWPAVEQQLAAANVVHGSALQKLVHDNQDFQLLRPDEAHDRLGIPHWLRVYWRKHHPDGNYSADNPSGGYPRMLRRVHEWMVMHQDLRAASDSGGTPRSTGGRHGD